MCGRFTLTKPSNVIASVFQVSDVPESLPRYNVSPSQTIATVRQSDKGRHLSALRWGLIPSWAKDSTMGFKLINARSETVAEKPSFRQAFKHRRCLVVADGFYEWQRTEGKSKKQPYYFHLKENAPFAFAGLWEKWQSSEDETIETCTILTTVANELLEPIHDRMPVILQPNDWEVWLDQEHNFAKPNILQSLLKPYSSQAMETFPVSNRVNSPKYDSPDCIQPQ